MLSIREEDKIVFLLTSTAFPYIRDVLDLLFLPSGFHYRFRYSKDWLPAELLTENGAKELEGKKAIIIHIHTTKEKEKVYRIREFIPIREVKIVSVKMLGEFLWVCFKLGDWIQYHEEPKSDELNEFHELFKKQVPQNSREFLKEMMFFVNKFEIGTVPDDSTGKNNEVIKNWH